MGLQQMTVLVGFLANLCQSQFHSFTSRDLDRKPFDFGDLNGMVVLVVNVASECGYTDSHYSALQQLQNALQPTGKFTVLGYPCNQFGKQEPGSAIEIKNFVKQYSVTFPLMSKVDVVGEGADPVWKYLTKSSGVSPQWNFYKYLVDGNGDVLKVWGPDTPVHDIIGDVELAVQQEQDHQVQVERPHAAGESTHDEL